MELVIGICDDSREQLELIKKYLYKYQDSVKIICSLDPNTFLMEAKEKQPQLVFLDIDMEILNGIELAERIKEESEDTVIIFITGHEEYALDAFRIRAFHYLLKPLTEEKFNRVFKEAVNFLQKNKSSGSEGTLTFRMGGEIISVFYSDIIFFEKVYHKIKVNCKDGVIEFYGSFKDLLDDINNDIFIRCHQGYIVNKDMIRIYKDKSLIMKGNIQIPVSRSNINKVKGILADRLFDRED